MRYLGVRSDPAGEVREKLERLAASLRQRIRPRHVLRVLDIRRTANGLWLDSVSLPGDMARVMLADCAQAALLVCTLGPGFDALMRQQQARGMAEAVLLDALGSAMVEEGCDAAEAELSGRCPGLHLTDRFSPGYGDLPLSIQPDILAATDATRRLGVTALPSCLMNPQKTVTAVVGLADKPQQARIRGCGHCALRERCAYRKGGTTCAY